MSNVEATAGGACVGSAARKPAAYCLDCTAPIFRESGRWVQHVDGGEVCDSCNAFRESFGHPRKRTFQIVK